MKKYVAEVFWTFVLVLVWCSAAVLNGDNIGYLGIAMAFGLTVTAMAYSIGHISGCHINPAVSFWMLLRRKMWLWEFIGYVACQISGAVLAAVTLMIIAGSNQNLWTNGFGEWYLWEYSMTSALITEVIFTAIFVLVIFACTSKKAVNDMAGVAIGLTLTVIILAILPVTGASLNPARSFGPAFIEWGRALEQVWLFFVWPMGWAFVAWIIWHFGFQKK